MNTITTTAGTATMMLIAVGQSIELEVQRVDELRVAHAAAIDD